MKGGKRRLRAVTDDAVNEGPIDEGATRGEIIAALVERVRAGDARAWGRLYHDHYADVYRHVRFLTGNSATAEDLTQETFIQAIRSIGSFDHRGKFSSWLRGVALNVVRHHWRAQRVRGAHAIDHMAELDSTLCASPGPDELTLGRQRVAWLYEGLGTLPPQLAEAFVLRELQQVSLEDAAAQLGVTPNNLAVRTSRAKRRLRRYLMKKEGKQ